MQLKQIRQLFLDYFAKNSHTIVASSSLVPHNDPTLLFTNAGMNQFKEVFLGEKSLEYIRAVSTQKCVRAGGKHNDLENVGYTARHHTFFEMLGNFSFGDYFKQQAIYYAWQFLTAELNIPKNLLYVTVYHDDDESYDIWSKLGVPLEHIIRIGVKADGSSDNFWQMGDTGPCGPCTEIFYDHGASISGGLPGSANQDGDRYIEIWNCVFMQFNRDSQGVLHKLPKPSVDTGMGLERIAAVMQGVHSNYAIDLFQDLIKTTAKLTNCIDLTNNSLKVLADHIRSVAFLIADGVIPSNEGRGYVLRRIIRRAVRHGYKLSSREAFFYNLVKPLAILMGESYPELITKQQLIISTIKDEEVKFFQTIEKGMGLLQQELAKLKGKVLDGSVAFTLYDTYGFPLDLTQDICKEMGLSIDIEGFEEAMLKQKTLAKSASKFVANHQSLDYVGDATEFLGYELHASQAMVLAVYPEEDSIPATCLVILDKTVFYAVGGGQIADKGFIILSNGMELPVIDVFKIKNNIVVHRVSSDISQWQINEIVNLKIDSDKRSATARNHSATHLLHQALREQLGESIEQKGSLVNSNYLRFDFSYNKGLTNEELSQIELAVNQAILMNYEVEISSTSYQNALKQGAIALFGDKYDKDMVRLVKIGNYSTELCGGTHVNRSGDIGLFIINSESGIANGIRRIEAVTGEVAYNQSRQQYDLINQLRNSLKVASINEINPKLINLVNDNKNLAKRLSSMEEKLALSSLPNILKQKQTLGNGIDLVITELKEVNSNTLMSVFQAIRNQLTKSIVIVVALIDDKINFIVGVAKELTPKYDAGVIASKLAAELEGKAGGKPEFAKGTAMNYQNLAKAKAKVLEHINTL